MNQITPREAEKIKITTLILFGGFVAMCREANAEFSADMVGEALLRHFPKPADAEKLFAASYPQEHTILNALLTSET